jgi:hypothetical protein
MLGRYEYRDGRDSSVALRLLLRLASGFIWLDAIIHGEAQVISVASNKC